MMTISELCESYGYSYNVCYSANDAGTKEVLHYILEDAHGNNIKLTVYNELFGKSEVVETVFTLSRNRYNQFDTNKHPSRLQELVNASCNAKGLLYRLDDVNWRSEFPMHRDVDAA